MKNMRVHISYKKILFDNIILGLVLHKISKSCFEMSANVVRPYHMYTYNCKHLGRRGVSWLIISFELLSLDNHASNEPKYQLSTGHHKIRSERNPK